MSAFDAWSNAVSGGGGQTHHQAAHTLEFVGTTNVVWYYVVVEGTATDRNASASVDQRVISGANVEWLTENFTVISGLIKGDTDTYDIDGTVVEFLLGDGDVGIFWDGQDITSNPQQIVQPVQTIPSLGQPGACTQGDCPQGFSCQNGLCVEDTGGGGGGGGGGGLPLNRGALLLALIALGLGVYLLRGSSESESDRRSSM